MAGLPPLPTLRRTIRLLSTPQDSESPSRLRLCPLVAPSLHVTERSLVGTVLCAHDNKGGPDLVVTMGDSILWCPQRTEVPTTPRKESHIFSGHTTPSLLAVPGRTFCTVIGRGRYPRPRHQGGEGPMMEAGYTFFFLCFREGTSFERWPPSSHGG